MEYTIGILESMKLFLQSIYFYIPIVFLIYAVRAYKDYYSNRLVMLILSIALVCGEIITIIFCAGYGYKLTDDNLKFTTMGCNTIIDFRQADVALVNCSECYLGLKIDGLDIEKLYVGEYELYPMKQRAYVLVVGYHKKAVLINTGINSYYISVPQVENLYVKLRKQELGIS